VNTPTVSHQEPFSRGKQVSCFHYLTALMIALGNKSQEQLYLRSGDSLEWPIVEVTNNVSTQWLLVALMLGGSYVFNLEPTEFGYMTKISSLELQIDLLFDLK
jgi:hypothetical protein